MAEAVESPEMEERRTLESWVKQQLPGGFAAARLIGTGRRKTAVARVVLVEGTGKIVINNRTAQVPLTLLLSILGLVEHTYISRLSQSKPFSLTK